MGLVIVDRRQQLPLLQHVARLARGIDLPEHPAQLPGVGLAQEGIEFLDQRRHRRLLVHRLVGQRSELGAERGHHPARQIQIFPVGRAEMLFDGDHLLLADETMPAAQRLGIVGRIGIIGRHIPAHDRRSIAGDIEAGLELVLQTHARHGLGVDPVPGAVPAPDELLHLADMGLVGHVSSSLCR